MELKELIKDWFDKWEKGDFLNLPITEGFTHTSPFGIIEGKDAYTHVVQENKDKFLGYTFEIHDVIYASDKASVRYTAKQGEALSLDVSEWYYVKDNLIDQIIAYYHMGEIRDDRKIDDYDN